MAERVQTLVQLTDELVGRLDREAARRSTSRSALIRELLEEGLGQDEDAIGLAIAEGYTRMPQSEGRDAWGDLNEWVEINARRNMAALAEEESEPW